MSSSRLSVLATGLSGLIGSKLAQVLSGQYRFTNLDISDPNRPVDITDQRALTAAFRDSPARTVLHLAAYTDVTGAWHQTDNTAGPAYRVNVLGTQNIVAASQLTGKHLVHVSTAYVFDGDNPHLYTEQDQPHPIEWYGQTKWLAEQAVSAAHTPWTILRIDQPFRSDPFPKLDFAHRIVQGLRSSNLHPLFSNHFFGPTFVDDFARVIDWVVQTGATGLFHASSGEQWSDYQFGLAIQRALGLEGTIREGDLDEYLRSTDRPYQRNTSLDTSKLLKASGLKLRSVEAAIQNLKPVQ
ncbi:MAG: hypothetical protein COU69_04755 [Candidatus Pacebacteria bacterium CG10_big_fil_rev_8_21_14_0_10_56_10]|nr:MAG: hypothetical protein COU69_04755 [Candidatus Pacebacteria bacterium CG10_big_fil_rev_8_21_14_0_10_56_10]